METTKLYVGNLSYAVTESKLEETFSVHGNVKSVNLITDSETISKAVSHLETAKVNEIQAVDSLKEALLIWN